MNRLNCLLIKYVISRDILQDAVLRDAVLNVSLNHCLLKEVDIYLTPSIDLVDDEPTVTTKVKHINVPPVRATNLRLPPQGESSKKVCSVLGYVLGLEKSFLFCLCAEYAIVLNKNFTLFFNPTEILFVYKTKSLSIQK